MTLKCCSLRGKLGRHLEFVTIFVYTINYFFVFTRFQMPWCNWQRLTVFANLWSNVKKMWTYSRSQTRACILRFCALKELMYAKGAQAELGREKLGRRNRQSTFCLMRRRTGTSAPSPFLLPKIFFQPDWKSSLLSKFLSYQATKTKAKCTKISWNIRLATYR